MKRRMGQLYQLISPPAISAPDGRSTSVERRRLYLHLRCSLLTAAVAAGPAPLPPAAIQLYEVSSLICHRPAIRLYEVQSLIYPSNLAAGTSKKPCMLPCTSGSAVQDLSRIDFA
jgi:hypothetical protein